MSFEIFIYWLCSMKQSMFLSHPTFLKMSDTSTLISFYPFPTMYNTSRGQEGKNRDETEIELALLCLYRIA